MTDDDPFLIDLADAVLDGRPLDWATATSSITESHRSLIPHFQTIAAIASFAGISSLGDSASLTALGIHAPYEQPPTWGALTILSEIGHGRFGRVYRAIDPRLDRPVALKLLRRRERDAESAVVDEGRLIARVRHPNVVTVYGAERIDGRTGLWMELIEGQTLEEELRRRGPLPAEEVAAIGVDLCRALAAIHRAGLLHRDLKAQNVLRDRDGRIVVTDFGAGLELSDVADGVNDLAGTPLYLAPEVLDGSPPTQRSDIYSLGVLLFHLLTNSYPVGGRTLADVREAHRDRRYARLDGTRPDLDETFIRAIEDALAFDPDTRCPAANAFEAALSQAGATATSTHPVMPVHARSTTRVSRRLVLVGIAVATAVVIGAALAPSRSDDGVRTIVADKKGALRKVRLPAGAIGWPSSDGGLVPYIDVSGSLQTWEVATGRARPVANAESVQQSILKAVMSPTGDRVAYASRLAGAYELRVIGADGKWPRVLIARETAYELIPVDWSRDGRDILCLFRQSNRNTDFVLVPVDGGQPRLLHTFTSAVYEEAHLSPDGRFVAASVHAGGDDSRADVVIVGVDGSDPHVAAEGIAPFSAPLWTPDGTHVFFLRESAAVRNSRDGWIVRVVEGAPNGDPVMVAPNLGTLSWMHLGDDGELARMIGNVSSDVYIRPIDVTGVEPSGTPSRVLPQAVGNHVAPSWSPDGLSLAYFTIRAAEAAGAVPLKTLTMQDVVSGQTRDLQLPLSFLGGYTPQWSPDGRNLIVWGADQNRDDRFGYYRVDVRTSETRAVVIIGNNNWPAMSQWSPDGRDFFYRDPKRGVIARDVSTGRERVAIPDRTGSISAFRIAPDGRSIALTLWNGDEDNSTTVLAVHAVDGTSHELLRAKAPQYLRLHAWTPDSRYVLYTTTSQSMKPHQLWSIPGDGGPSLDLRFSIIRSGGNEPNTFSLSPDGRRVAYAERTVEQELWIEPVKISD